MFCRQCGCELGENDRFCFNCGTPVQKVDPAAVKAAPIESQEEAPAEPEVIESPEVEAAPEQEAAAPEPEVESFVEIGSEEIAAMPDDDMATAGIEHEAFDWNVYAFPTDAPRKTEDVEFDWGIAEGEYKRRPREDDREIAFAPEPPAAPQAQVYDEEPEITKEELFGGSVVSGIAGEGEGLSKQAAKIDKFYKEDKRIEEFQKLLDSEYEKFRAGRPLDQDSFAETVESIKERTAPGRGRAPEAMFGGAAEDLSKTAVFHRVSGLEKTPAEPETTTIEDIEKLLSKSEAPEAAEPEAGPEPAPESKKAAKGGLFGFAARRADKNRTLEMEKEEIQNALDSVFTTKTPQETINDIFGDSEEEQAKEAIQEELDRQIDDKTTEYDPSVLKEKLAEAEAAEKAAETEPEVPAETPAEVAEAEPEAPAETPVEAAEAEPEAPAETPEEVPEAEPEAPAEAEPETPAEAEAPAEAPADAKEKPAEETKTGKGGTVAIVILALILVALLALIGIKFFFPEFMAENNAVPTAAAMDKTEYSGDLNGVIQTQLGENYGEEIKEIKYDSSWKAKGMDGTKKIKDNVWYKKKDGTVCYIDEAVVGTVIAYESRMQAMDQNGDLKVLDYIKEGTDLRADTEAVLSSSKYEPMKSLTFGKIRKTEDGAYCVWVREEKNSVTKKIITLEADGHKLLVTAEQEL